MSRLLVVAAAALLLCVAGVSAGELGVPPLPSGLAGSSRAADLPAQVAVPQRSAKATPCTGYARQDNCVGNPPLAPGPLPSCAGFSGPLPANTTAFAVIGDYGLDGQCMAQVAALTLKLQQQFGEFAFIMTLGDNGYWTGTCQAYNTGVGKYYASFLPGGVAPSHCTDPSKKKNRILTELMASNAHLRDKRAFEEHQALVLQQQARIGLGPAVHAATEERTNRLLEELLLNATAIGKARGMAAAPRFYPSLGNHDWTTYGNVQHTMPYFQYFGYLASLPPASMASGQFYQVMSPIPGVELFSINSNLGNPSSSPSDRALHLRMVAWLEGAVRNSSAPFKLVYFHHPPFSTAEHDALSPWMDLDYEGWGVSMVLVGHEHTYERFIVSRDGGKTNMPYILNGLGGHPWTYQIEGCPAAKGSQFRYNKFHGMQLAIHSFDEKLQKEKIDFCFYTLEDGGKLVDSVELQAGPGKQQ